MRRDCYHYEIFLQFFKIFGTCNEHGLQQGIMLNILCSYPIILVFKIWLIPFVKLNLLPIIMFNTRSYKDRQKTVCRSVFLTIWHCNLGAELTHSLRLFFFWRFCPLGIDDMQFGFVPGRGTTNVFFILCQLLVCQQRIVKSILHFFLYEKSSLQYFGRVCANLKFMSGSSSDPFKLTVDVHQGSVLSPLLFIIDSSEEVTQSYYRRSCALQWWPWRIDGKIKIMENIFWVKNATCQQN